MEWYKILVKLLFDKLVGDKWFGKNVCCVMDNWCFLRFLMDKLIECLIESGSNWNIKNSIGFGLVLVLNGVLKED